MSIFSFLLVKEAKKPWSLETSTLLLMGMIALLAVTFGCLFVLYAVSKCKIIYAGLEDETIRKDTKSRFRRAIQASCEQAGDLTEKERNKRERETIFACLNKKKKKPSFYYVFSAFVSVVFIASLALAIFYRSDIGCLHLADRSYLIVETGSMATVNERNTYIKSNHLNNQIAQHALVCIEDVTQEEIKQYDVCAYLHEGTVYVHRIIKITHVGDKVTYTFRGDANSTSLDFETAVTYDQIVGRYTAQNEPLGYILSFFRSNTGILVLSAVLLFFIFLGYSDSKIDKAYIDRAKQLYKEKNDESD